MHMGSLCAGCSNLSPGWMRDFLGAMEVGCVEVAGQLIQGGVREERAG